MWHHNLSGREKGEASGAWSLSLRLWRSFGGRTERMAIASGESSSQKHGHKKGQTIMLLIILAIGLAYGWTAVLIVKDLSRAGFWQQCHGDKPGMAATPAEGTARKLVTRKCGRTMSKSENRGDGRERPLFEDLKGRSI